MPLSLFRRLARAFGGSMRGRRRGALLLSGLATVMALGAPAMARADDPSWCRDLAADLALGTITASALGSDNMNGQIMWIGTLQQNIDLAPAQDAPPEIQSGLKDMSRIADLSLVGDAAASAKAAGALGAKIVETASLATPTCENATVGYLASLADKQPAPAALRSCAYAFRWTNAVGTLESGQEGIPAILAINDIIDLSASTNGLDADLKAAGWSGDAFAAIERLNAEYPPEPSDASGLSDYLSGIANDVAILRSGFESICP
jgi:hypothetical protein